MPQPTRPDLAAVVVARQTWRLIDARAKELLLDPRAVPTRVELDALEELNHAARTLVLNGRAMTVESALSQMECDHADLPDLARSVEHLLDTLTRLLPPAVAAS
jgi:hypothetical protein